MLSIIDLEQVKLVEDIKILVKLLQNYKLTTFIVLLSVNVLVAEDEENIFTIT